MITWTENNGSFLAYRDGKYCGMASQIPNDSRLMNPGKWSAVWHMEDGGISSCGDYDTDEEAKEKVEIELSLKNQLTGLRGKAYYKALKSILNQCGENIITDANAMKPITALTIAHLALLYQLPYKAVCEWLEENKVLPTGTYDELIRRGLKVGEVFDIVKEQYTV